MFSKCKHVWALQNTGVMGKKLQKIHVMACIKCPKTKVVKVKK